MPRVSKRKADVSDLLAKNDPSGFGLLNELCVKSWTGPEGLRSNRYANHKRSFCRTFVKHAPPLYSICFERGYDGTTEALAADVLARWSLWHLVEKAYLAEPPSSQSIEFIVGADACTAVTTLQSGERVVIGTTCFLKQIWLVAESERSFLENLKANPLLDFQLLSVSENGLCEHIDPKMPVWKLRRLPYEARFPDGQELSMARMKIVF